MADVRETLVALVQESERRCNDLACEECCYHRENSCFAQFVVDDLIAKGVTVQKWTPVKVRLPDLELEKCECEPGEFISYETSDWLWGISDSGMQVRVKYESGPCFQGWYDDYGATWKITHWMPLPEQPKEGA